MQQSINNLPVVKELRAPGAWHRNCQKRRPMVLGVGLVACGEDLCLGLAAPGTGRAS